MDWSDFSGKKIALLGAGKENISLIPLLLKQGAEVVVCDKGVVVNKLPKNIEVRSGETYLENLDYFDYVFRSPGLPLNVVDLAIEKLTSKPVVTSAMNLLISLKREQTIGVTGTKGKGTTAAMITEIIKASDKQAILVGNIGESVFDNWDRIDSDTYIVAELSSFQLEDIKVSPKTAVLLSVTVEHLQPLSEISPNFHKDLPTYVKAKEKITAFQKPDDLIVFSKDSQSSNQIGLSSRAKKISVSSRGNADVSVNNGVIELGEDIVDLKNDTDILGSHNYFNAAIAAAVTKEIGLSTKNIIKGLATFKPLKHRMEKVGVYGGIEFIDDSYATAPDATIAALSAFEGREISLILGGSSKGAQFDDLAKAAESRVKRAVLIGQEAKNIERSFKKFAPKVKLLLGFSSFRDAVETAIHRTSSGGVVLLSPACASKDMFKNAADRGDKFKRVIHELF